MPFEFIQIPANGQGNAREELNKLLRGGRIASVRKEFVANGEDSFWAFCVEYLDGVLAAAPSASSRGTPKIDYKEVLDLAQFAVFARLRELRKGLNRPPSRSPSPAGGDKTTRRPPGASSTAAAVSNVPGGLARAPLHAPEPPIIAA